MPNLAALRAAIFLLSAKNRWGGTYVPPPGRARVKAKNTYQLQNKISQLIPVITKYLIENSIAII